MIVEAERLVCTNHECVAEFVVGRKPALETQNLRCACGSELKKYYRAPKLWIYGGDVRPVIIYRPDQLEGCDTVSYVTGTTRR